MRKFTPASVLVAMATLFLATACSEESTQAEATSADTSSAIELAARSFDGEGSIMDQPVDFSSEDNVEISLETIRKYAGDNEANSIENAMDYMLFYDLGLGKDKNKLYKKLDGKTPNEILASTGR